MPIDDDNETSQFGAATVVELIGSGRASVREMEVLVGFRMATIVRSEVIKSNSQPPIGLKDNLG
jgi:hypothetical protein